MLLGLRRRDRAFCYWEMEQKQFCRTPIRAILLGRVSWPLHAQTLQEVLHSLAGCILVTRLIGTENSVAKFQLNLPFHQARYFLSRLSPIILNRPLDQRLALPTSCWMGCFVAAYFTTKNGITSTSEKSYAPEKMLGQDVLALPP